MENFILLVSANGFAHGRFNVGDVRGRNGDFVQLIVDLDLM